ncbi:hypothetical protein BK133_11070 [Paenibacillus sp. FSL H8-0548]|uniref:helix-turn-helix domain-containing protein n=1 Tax=Paenibacillus sp. FSL H8-0548 TaxID=1920422 RepID=UPI00096F44C8|nr:helix-turn-helix transcriptional regulator [Paenibacillus sp. FSL H8-0548]OMF35245.1 hypothetical protein BK133_11070 [Paenibacillus sp. FSL H8-0548]
MAEDNNMSKLTGERIRALRNKSGLYQADLAEKLGVVRENVSKYELGKVTPPSNVLNSLADLLHTSTDYLLGKTENSTPVDPEMELNKDIELSDSQLLEKYNFKVDGQSIDEETIKRILDYLRAEKRLKG